MNRITLSMIAAILLVALAIKNDARPPMPSKYKHVDGPHVSSQSSCLLNHGFAMFDQIRVKSII
jgi:hypothetical protein